MLPIFSSSCCVFSLEMTIFSEISIVLVVFVDGVSVPHDPPLVPHVRSEAIRVGPRRSLDLAPPPLWIFSLLLLLFEVGWWCFLSSSDEWERRRRQRREEEHFVDDRYWLVVVWGRDEERGEQWWVWKRGRCWSCWKERERKRGEGVETFLVA